MTTPFELAKKCKDTIDRGLEHVQLVLPRKTRRRGYGLRVVVFSKPRLYGELCCENADGHAVVFVKALDLLAWLAATGAIKVEFGERPREEVAT
jgi:hypothetical protein